MELAPIVLFVYSRPELTKTTLETLAANKEAAASILYVYSDGPKPSASPEMLQRINEVRNLVRSKQWCKEVVLMDAEKNKGLARSVIDGVTEIVNRHEKAIILEDDIIISPHFLSFMNNALEKYKDDSRVGSIAGWNYFCSGKLSENFFFRLPDSISWGIYKRSWKLFEPDADSILDKINTQALKDRLNVGNAVNLLKTLEQQKERKVDSWAVKWTASCVINNLLTLYPHTSLTKHVGYGETSTHCKDDYDEFNYKLKVATQDIPLHDIPVKENESGVRHYQHFYGLRRNRLFRYYNKIRQRYEI
jgi:hypothetical protein